MSLKCVSDGSFDTEGAKLVEMLEKKFEVGSSTVRVRFGVPPRRVVDDMSDVDEFTAFLRRLHPKLKAVINGEWLTMNNLLEKKEYWMPLHWLWADQNREVLRRHLISVICRACGLADLGHLLRFAGVPPTGFQLQFPEQPGTCKEYEAEAAAAAAARVPANVDEDLELSVEELAFSLEQLSINVHVEDDSPDTMDSDTGYLVFGPGDTVVTSYGDVAQFHRFLSSEVPELDSRLCTSSAGAGSSRAFPAAFASQITGKVDRSLKLRRPDGESFAFPVAMFFSDGNLVDLMKLLNFLGLYGCKLPMYLRRRKRSGFRSPKVMTPWSTVQLEYE